MEEKALRPVVYADKDELEEEILSRRYAACSDGDEDDEADAPPADQGGARMSRTNLPQRGQSHQKPIRTP